MDDPRALPDGERVDIADGEVPHSDRSDLDRIAVDGARAAVELDDLGAGIEGGRLDPAGLGQEAMVGRRLDRLAVDREVLDLLVGVDEDGADGVGQSDQAGVRVAILPRSSLSLPARSQLWRLPEWLRVVVCPVSAPP